MQDIVDRIPLPPFPTGWWAVSFSSALPAGAVRPLRYFSRELVLFRTESGVPVLADAACPHLGAHLGEGGAVIGETIRCPFHHWRFDAAGKCREALFAPPPAKAKLTLWPVIEQNGMILTWYDEAGRPPSWDFPIFPEGLAVGHREWQFQIHSHPQEVFENGSDVTHFTPIHGFWPLRPAGPPEIDGPFFGCHGASYKPEGDARPDATFRHLIFSTRMAGPGFNHGISPLAGIEGATIGNLYYGTPIDPGLMDFRIIQYIRCEDPVAATQITAKMADSFHEGTKAGLLDDAPIFRRKQYRPTPLLSAADGPIIQYRRWYAQFYPSAGEAKAAS